MTQAPDGPIRRTSRTRPCRRVQTNRVKSRPVPIRIPINNHPIPIRLRPASASGNQIRGAINRATDPGAELRKDAKELGQNLREGAEAATPALRKAGETLKEGDFA